MNDNNDFLHREAIDKIISWLDRPEAIVIKGPRQSGKTTLLRMLERHLREKGVQSQYVLYFNFENRRRLDQFTSSPLEFVRAAIPADADVDIDNKGQKVYLLLDEYQYVTDGGQKLKLLFDTYSPPLKLIITGSSSLELTFQLGKYMVGRLFTQYLFPLTFNEFLRSQNSRLYRVWQEKNRLVLNFLLQKKIYSKAPQKDIFFSELAPFFQTYVRYGGYPAVITAKGTDIKAQILEHITETYINRDIIALLREESTSEFQNLIRILASQTGQLLNYQQLANDTGLYYKKVKHFLSILEETYLIRRIKPYHRNLTTELKKNPKAYFLDSGLRNYLVGNFSKLDYREDKGSLVESVVLANIFYPLGVSLQSEIHFWRTAGGAELDFLLQKGMEFHPIEVKYRSFKQPKLEKSLYSFISAYKPPVLLVLTKDFWRLTETASTKILFAPALYCSF